MSITDVNTAPGQITSVLSKPSIHNYFKYPQAIHNYCEPSQMKPTAIIHSSICHKTFDSFSSYITAVIDSFKLIKM